MKFSLFSSKKRGKDTQASSSSFQSDAEEIADSFAAVGGPSVAEEYPNNGPTNGSDRQNARELALVAALQAKVATLSQSLEEEKLERKQEVERERRLRERLQERYDAASMPCGGSLKSPTLPNDRQMNAQAPVEWQDAGATNQHDDPRDFPTHLPPPQEVSAIEALLGITCGVRLACDEDDELPQMMTGCGRADAQYEQEAAPAEPVSLEGEADNTSEEKWIHRSQAHMPNTSVQLANRRKADDYTVASDAYPVA